MMLLLKMMMMMQTMQLPLRHYPRWGPLPEMRAVERMGQWTLIVARALGLQWPMLGLSHDPTTTNHKRH